eukprot:TRINITY_DN9802_c0_g2_i6.p1 TRINITY_DN9802_c0_g2~~TRINITY_DN9802_c0_g2_i6.p1  ORF type:complete len:659 (+),score=163.06 TRINITY_DN9802_c0_g2_i6:140-2116(+)
MITRFYSPRLIEEFEKQLNAFLKDTKPIPEQYRKSGADLCRIRKTYKELIIVNTVYDINGAKSSLRLIKTQYMDDLDTSQPSPNPESYQKLYDLRIVLESVEEEKESGLELHGVDDSVEKEAVREFVPTKFIMNKEESLFVLYNKQMIVAGRLPYLKSESNESTIDLRIVGQPFAMGSGREVQKVEFHPLNGSYIGVLTTRGTFSLYDLTSDLDKPEQDFELLKRYSADSRTVSDKKLVSSFCFGNKENYGWSAFSVYLLGNGEVYCLCPVVPGAAFIEPLFVSVLSESVKREQMESAKLHELKNEFVNLFVEGEQSDTNEHCLVLDMEKLLELKPMIQGPIKLYRNAAGDAAKIYVDLISFDCFPYVFLMVTSKGTIDVAVSWTDSAPVFKSSARVGMGLHEFKVAPCNLLWVVFSQIVLVSEVAPVLYCNPKDPFVWFAGVEGNLYQITNAWLYELQKLYLASSQRIDKELVRRLEGSQVTLAAKGDYKYGGYLGAETIDDYLILVRPTATLLQARIFNTYNTIALTRHKRKARKVETRAETARFGGESKFLPIDYKALTAIEPFLLKEEEKDLEPLDVLEYLQKTLPRYFALVKRDAERKVLQEDINIVKKHEENIEKLIGNLERKIKDLESGKAEVSGMAKEVEEANVSLAKSC